MKQKNYSEIDFHKAKENAKRTHKSAKRGSCEKMASISPVRLFFVNVLVHNFDVSVHSIQTQFFSKGRGARYIQRR
jgi:hypothetical protein